MMSTFLLPYHPPYDWTGTLAFLRGRINLFDLSARPNLIKAHLEQHETLKSSVLKNPGLRVPGAFDRFEMAIRAILGQQITVKAATTISSRFASHFGEEAGSCFGPQLIRFTPQSEMVAKGSSSLLINGNRSPRPPAPPLVSSALYRNYAIWTCPLYPNPVEVATTLIDKAGVKQTLNAFWMGW